MLKISGLDALSRQFEEAEEALKNINGEIGVASFISDDPASIEAAIQHINARFFNLHQMMVVRSGELVWNKDPNAFWDQTLVGPPLPEEVVHHDYLHKAGLLKLPCTIDGNKKGFITRSKGRMFSCR